MPQVRLDDLNAICLSIPKDRALTHPAQGASFSQDREFNFQTLNRVYERWQKEWIKIFEDLGSLPGSFRDDFSRFSFVYCLMDSDATIAGFLCSTLFDFRLKPHRDHSYIKRYPVDFVNEALKRNEPTCLSLEYCYVDPSWRKDHLPLSLVDVLLCLCARKAFALGIDQVVAVTRNDRSVNQVVYARGGDPVLTEQELHHVKIDLIKVRRDTFKFGHLPYDAWIEELADENTFVENKNSNEKGAHLV